MRITAPLLSVLLLGCGHGGDAAGSGACPGPAHPGAAETAVDFFVDMSSKAPQPGYVYRYVYVIWNKGGGPAENVDLSLPLLQVEPTWTRLSGVTFVPGSMGVNRTYNPDTSKESYAFVPLDPLTDGADCDEGTFDAAANTVHYHRGEMPAAGSGENNYAVFGFAVQVDSTVDCTQNQLLQALSTVAADNAPSYQNDIAGQVVCDSPKLKAKLSVDKPSAPAGSTVVFTIGYTYDSVPIDKPGRFDLARVRITHTFPANVLAVSAAGNGGVDQGGAVFWQIDNLAAGASGSVSWTAQIKPGAMAGTTIPTSVGILSQNTVTEQDSGDQLSLTVAP